MKQAGDAQLARHVIKRYAGDRLYDTATLSYVTMEGIHALLRRDVEVTVIEAETGVDITRSVLTVTPQST